MFESYILQHFIKVNWLFYRSVKFSAKNFLIVTVVVDNLGSPIKISGYASVKRQG